MNPNDNQGIGGDLTSGMNDDTPGAEWGAGTSRDVPAGFIDPETDPYDLDPGESHRARALAGQAGRTIRQAGMTAGRSVLDQVRANPIPIALIGAGLFLLLRRDDSYDVEFTPEVDFDDPGTPVPRGGEMGRRTAETLESVRGRTSQLMERASESAGQLRTQARMRARTAAGDVESFITGNPLVAGLAAAALGAIAGAVIPESQRENEMFGSRRDELLDRGRTMAREGLGRARSTVRQKAKSLLDDGSKDGERSPSATVTSANDWGDTETP